jgi:hypothetical protein
MPTFHKAFVTRTRTFARLRIRFGPSMISIIRLRRADLNLGLRPAMASLMREIRNVERNKRLGLLCACNLVRVPYAPPRVRQVGPTVHGYEYCYESACSCGHSWEQHTRHASGVEMCRYSGCGCRGYEAVEESA